VDAFDADTGNLTGLKQLHVNLNKFRYYHNVEQNKQDSKIKKFKKNKKKNKKIKNKKKIKKIDTSSHVQIDYCYLLWRIYTTYF